ncbi:hypothetical protein I6F35_03585 [Bradyrhizobium sp. BRP22]|uniref:hypothetical protein n=1 Tax=Bradyrhizobium sp. BRP22 TaxID=2793821 RepID=UPI001CD74368|nr:hypothetical protein [Bradyrhizobium sp. BRP22]MCA1452299.1 hypothetical protein [Bradyrhizobium sp. BRP22]
MQKVIQRALRTILVSVLVSAGAGPVLAQSGSAGGSIGNDEKSLSGSREAPRAADSDRPARRSKPESEEPRRASRKSGGEGGGGGNFDGAWVVVSVGTTCSGGSTTAVVVSSGKIIGQGVSGRVSPSGAVNAFGNANGITVISTGRISARSGSGSFRQSDGCIGRWTASKQ